MLSVFPAPGLSHLAAKKGNHRLVCLKRTVGAAYVEIVPGFGQPGVHDPPLSRCVFVVGTRRFGDDIDHSARDFEFKAVTGFDPGARRTLRGTTRSVSDFTITVIAPAQSSHFHLQSTKEGVLPRVVS